MLDGACVSVTGSSADGPRVIIHTRNVRASGTDDSELVVVVIAI